MSNAQHTAEPWKINGSRVEGQDGALVAGVFDGSLSDCEDHAAREANARRIVACVNAAAGIETEVLEQDGPTALTAASKLQLAEVKIEGLQTQLQQEVNGSKAAIQRVHDRWYAAAESTKRLTTERDQLLAALEDLIGTEQNHIDPDVRIQRAQAAIDAVKVGAQ